MFYEWKVINSAEIDNYKFPYIEKELQISNFYDQRYRIWKTSHAISLYHNDRRVFVLFMDIANKGYYKFGENDFFKLVLLDDGTYDIYHGQEG